MFDFDVALSMSKLEGTEEKAEEKKRGLDQNLTQLLVSFASFPS
jgi:hypothetical protein